MRIADYIWLADHEVTPEQTKVHLAGWNGSENPLDVYLANEFDEWQCWQGRRNFERRFVVSLISLSETNLWLYVGVYNSEGAEWSEDNQSFRYQLAERVSCSEFKGRLIVGFERPGRQSYLNMEKWTDSLKVAEIRQQPVSIGEFPGFKELYLTKRQLDIVVNARLESWRTVLSNVAGVYLVSDTTSGKLYVGSACGEGGIWQRWSQYSACGHAGNLELKRMLQEEGGLPRADAFRFSILEIADVHATSDEILNRESHWKRVLFSRQHGLNAN